MPPSRKLIALSLIGGLMLNLLPWQGFLLLLRPDFVALLLLYWCVNQPARLGIGTAWVMGVIMDVADGTLLGEHALAYVLVTYLALALRRRILMFTLWQQALHIVLLLLLLQGTLLLLHLAAGASFIGWSYFLAALTGTLLWAPLSFLLQLAQRKKTSPESKVSP